MLTAKSVIAVEGIALIACLCIPGMRGTAARNEANHVASEIRDVIRVATISHEKTGEWPEDVGPGCPPASLTALLPAGTKFDAKRYQLDWDHWKLSDGPDSFSRTREFVAVSFTAHDPQLMRLVSQALGSERRSFRLGDRASFVIISPSQSRP